MPAVTTCSDLSLDVVTRFEAYIALGFLFANHVLKAACQKCIARRMMAHERILD